MSLQSYMHRLSVSWKLDLTETIVGCTENVFDLRITSELCAIHKVASLLQHLFPSVMSPLLIDYYVDPFESGLRSGSRLIRLVLDALTNLALHHTVFSFA